MSDISTKLTYLNTTKSNLKDMINNGLDSENQITSSTTFREYVSSIFEAFLEALRNPDTLFTNLPKTSASGSNITLNGTAYAPMRITLNPTAISQDGTPTPDNPQDIHTISGNNSVVVEGKNLLPFINQDFTLKNVRYYVQNGSLYLNGTSTGETSSTDTNFKNNFSFYLDAGTYRFSCKQSTQSTPFYIRKYSDNTEIGVLNTKTLTSSSFTLNEKTQVYLSAYVYQATFDNYSLEIQIEKGSTATTYTPYVSQTNPINLGEYELGTIGNYSNEFVRSNGENYFNPTYQIQTIYKANGNTDTTTTYTLSNNEISITKSYGDYGRYMLNKLSLEAGTYTLSFLPSLSGTEKKMTTSIRDMDNLTDIVSAFGTDLTGSIVSVSFTINATTNVSISIQPTNSNCGTLTIREIMLNKGTTALSYVPYEKGWYYKQGIGKVVLDGTQNINSCNVSSGNSNMVYAYTTIFDDYIASSYGICDKLIKSNVELSTATNSNDEMFSLSTSWGGTRFYLDKTRLSEVSVAGFKTWLSNNNITIYYTLKTPTYTKITGELAQELEQVYKGMLSYDGTTNISQVNNDLAFVINASGILGE